MAHVNRYHSAPGSSIRKPWFKRVPWLEVMRFGIVGALSTGLYLLILYPTKQYVPGPLWLVSAIAYFMSMAVNYAAQRRVTFRSDRRHQEAITRFIVVQLTALVINSVILDILVQRAGYPFWFGQGVAVGATSVFSYVAQKIWVFWRRGGVRT